MSAINKSLQMINKKETNRNGSNRGTNTVRRIAATSCLWRYDKSCVLKALGLAGFVVEEARQLVLIAGASSIFMMMMSRTPRRWKVFGLAGLVVRSQILRNQTKTLWSRG